MKKVVIFMCSFLIFITILLILYTQQGRSIRQTELNNAVTSSLDKTMSMLMAEKDVAPSSNDEFKALFEENLALQIESSSNVITNFLVVDVEKGIMSVEVILEYAHPIGTVGKVSCSKTAILEQYTKETFKRGYSIQFLIDGEIYKSYELQEGTRVINPGNPSKDGKTFLGWRDADSNDMVAIDGLVVSGNRVFVAVFD